MATLTLNQASDMFSPGYVWYGSITGYSSSHISLSNGYYSATYYGSFYYSSYGLAGGTVSSYYQYAGGQADYSISGLSANALTVKSYLDSGNFSGLRQYVMGGGDSIYGSSSSDRIEGYAGNDYLSAGNGDDSLRGGSGNDTLDGGAGTDTAVYSGYRSSYSVTATATGYSITGPDGTDTLTSIEYVSYLDQTVQSDYLIPDTTAPVITYLWPFDGSSDIDIDTNLGITFSEAIQRGTGTIFLKTAAGTVIENYDAATSQNLSFSGATLTINPTANLSYGTEYVIEIPGGSIKDSSGNLFTGTDSYNLTTLEDTSNRGTTGNDTLRGGSGTAIDGSAGTDIVTYSSNRSAYTITHTPPGYTVSTGAVSDTLTNVETLQFGDQTIDLTPLNLYANRVNAFFLAWLGRTATPEELVTYCADYAEKAASGQTIYQMDLYTYLHDISAAQTSSFLASTDYGDVITDMYERLTGSRDVPQNMYEIFNSLLGTSWDATKLAVKMIKACGFWYNNGDFGKPAAFPFDFTASATPGQVAFEATLDAHATFDLTADALAELVVVGVSS
jgi:hypothetical protein